MGCCGSSLSNEEKQQLAASKAIDRKNKDLNAKENAKVKLLLLGTGESGKSTIFKQMKLLYGKRKFSDDERGRWTPTIYGNILTNMKTVLEHTESYTPITDESLKEKVDSFLALPDGKDAKIDEETGELIKAFWADAGVQDTWHNRADFQVQDALEYYCTEMDRIMASGYVPNAQDILRARIRTSGIVEEHYKIDGVEFVMYDVGGQRNERKKWIHCFDNVTAVIFVAAINEYNQVLYEDSSMNRLDEAVILFDEICNSPYFRETSIILFLNKADLFREKLAETPFRIAEGPDQRYVDFKGPYVKPGTSSSKIGSPEYEVCFEATKKYILQLFLNRNKNKGKEIYNHTCTATDTANVDVVFNASKDIILNKNLRGSGFVVG